MLRENISLRPVEPYYVICAEGTAFQNLALKPLFSNPPVAESFFIVETDVPW